MTSKKRSTFWAMQRLVLLNAHVLPSAFGQSSHEYRQPFPAASEMNALPGFAAEPSDLQPAFERIAHRTAPEQPIVPRKYADVTQNHTEATHRPVDPSLTFWKAGAPAHRPGDATTCQRTDSRKCHHWSGGRL